MLRHTFCHLPGVGEKKEQRLWEAGLTSWEAVLDRAQRGSSALLRRLALDDLRESARHHAGANPAWFAGRLPSAQAWRLFGDFRGSCAYVDIETTGMMASDHITTIALYDGRTIRTYVHGHNLAEFVRDIQAYRLLVTYNGKSFDVPFLERCLGCRLNQAHIDLRYVLAGLGLSGGLKGCERQLGLTRPGMEEVDGYVAVLLWRDFKRWQNRKALDTLLAYNVQDTVNLETLMVYAYNRRLAGLSAAPFAAAYRLPLPPAPVNPFRPDAGTIGRVLRDHPWLAARGGRLTSSAGTPVPEKIRIRTDSEPWT